MIDTKKLGEALRQRRSELGVSLSDVSEEVSVSTSTMSRIENGIGKPDTDILVALAHWLGVPPGRFLPTGADGNEPVIYYPDEPTPNIVEALLSVDLDLPPEARKALSNVFRAAYDGFTGIVRAQG